MVRLELVALSGIRFNEEVHEVVLPTPDGYIAVFTNHATLVTLADTGRIGIRRKAGDPDDFMEYFAVSGGVVDVNGNVVRVLVDEADRAEELVEADEKAALEDARKMLSQAHDQVSLDKAQSLIDRQTVRLQVATLKRRNRRRHIDNQTSR
jgi:F-type H+-transporting ATPase subunit epsilon